MSEVFRAPLRSRRDDVDHAAAVEWALDQGIVAVGGRLDARPSNLADAVARVADRTDERAANRLQRFADVPDGSFVFTRHPEGDVHLGRIDGPWRFDPSEEAARHDLQHTRACRWLPVVVAPSELPDAVALALARGGRNFQGTHGPGVEAQSQALWDRLASD